MDSEEDVAYVVPKLVWERVHKRIRELEGQQQQQKGGAIEGINKSGKVDTDSLLHAMAVNLSLQQSPQAGFVRYADEMMKKVLDDPTLSADDRLRYFESYVRAYKNQRDQALRQVPTAPMAPASTPALARPTPAPRRILPSRPPSYTQAMQPGSSGTQTLPVPKLSLFQGDSPITPATIESKIEQIKSSGKLSPAEKKVRIGVLTRRLAEEKKKRGEEVTHTSLSSKKGKGKGPKLKTTTKQ